MIHALELASELLPERKWYRELSKTSCEVFDVRTQVLLWNNDAAKINVEVFLKRLLGEVPYFSRLYRDAAQVVGP